jgi:DNA-binding transcriptional regulator YiaG
MNATQIKTLRQNLGVTQKRLAELLKCHTETVQAWEQGVRHPNDEFKEKLQRLSKKASKAKLDTSRAEE